MEDIQLNSIEKLSEQSPELPITTVPSEAIQKMAVLFTDIVGSTRFFKTYGNQAGREMLQRHEVIAGEGVYEHNGVLVKTIGDAILAYFLDPADAVRSAVSIQQKFLAHNRKQAEEKDEIHVRIGIHFGDGIIEKNDIFGNVVNLAAKINPLAGGDQIFVSHTVFELTDTQLPLEYALLDLPDKKMVLKGIRVYELKWDETVRFDPTTNTVVYMKPLWWMASESFSTVWQDFIHALDESKDVGLLKYETFGHKECALVFREIAHAAAKTCNILNQIRKQLSTPEPLLLIPIQIIIDFGAYLKDGRLQMDQFPSKWEDAAPGYIHMTDTATRTLQYKTTYPTYPPFDPKQPCELYRLAEKDGAQYLSLLFPYAQILVQGPNSPCFYCTSRRHLPSDCPSKTMENPDDALKKLQYTPLKSVNQSFFRYLNVKERDDISHIEGLDRQSGDPHLAFASFFDLSVIFQLRFFKNLWYSDQQPDWQQARQWRRNSGKGGGKLWLTLDCLRISDLYRADRFIRECHAEFENDYRLHCIKAFINIEKKETRQALDNFKRALSHAKTPSQKILIHLYIFRIHWLNADLETADKHIQHILQLQPRCMDALYLRHVMYFYTGEAAPAAGRMVRFIQENPEYFSVVMVDPALAPFALLIHPGLQEILDKARLSSRQIIKAVEEDFENMLVFVSDGTAAQRELRTLYAKMIEASDSDSYLGFLDIASYADTLLSRKESIIHGQKRQVYNQLHELKKECGRLAEMADPIARTDQTLTILNRIQEIRKDTSQLYQTVDPDDPDSCRATSDRAVALFARLNEEKAEIMRLHRSNQMRRMIWQFATLASLCVGIAVVIAYFSIPIYNEFIGMFSPFMRIPRYNVPIYRKWAMIIGGLTGLASALIWTFTRDRAR